MIFVIFFTMSTLIIITTAFPNLDPTVTLILLYLFGGIVVMFGTWDIG